MPRDGLLRGALAALVLGAAACGEAEATTATGRARRRRRAPRDAGRHDRARGDAGGESSSPDPADVRVVRDWADTLRAGNVRAAARYFAIPSLVANGTPPIKLKTRAEAEFFNQTLPCGAKLIDTAAAPHGFFIATFRLTERPGEGECGSGTGETARTAFRVRDAHITDWLRVQDIESAPETLS